MSADRELLELAAKAAGIGLPSIEDYDEIGRQYCTSLGLWAQRPWGWGWWNPLTDDGPALRLAVKLNLWEAIRLAHRLVGLPQCPDIYAATRLAVVRCAAEIGKAMP